MKIKLITITIIIILIASCSPAPSSETIQTAIAQTQNANQSQPTNTQPPPTITDTLAPTNTPGPTNTPRPTRTPRPTNTPRPTATPTRAPEPINYTGTGSTVLDIDKWPGPAVLHITNNSSRYFSVESYDANNERMDLLVNTSGPYDGQVLIDLYEEDHTSRLAIEATGDWTIDILPLEAALFLKIPGIIEGTGDDVIVICCNGDLATIIGNQSSDYFGVYSYGTNGTDLLVNTSDPYEGTVILPPGALILTVEATGPWTIELTSK